MPTPLAMRGLLIDAARLVESSAYYRRFIDFCAAWDVNTVLVRLADDQGSALRFPSHPELKTHPNALSPDEMRALVAYARDRQITLIPEIESFGHSRYITDVPEHADLRDNLSTGDWMEGIIPLHPRTLAMMSDLYHDVAAIFDGEYLHAGCDEVSWGGSAYSQQLLARSTRSEIWGEYLNALQRIAEHEGKTLIVWGDFVLRNEPDILQYLNPKVIIHDWEYDDVNPLHVTAMIARATEKGFRVIGGPAAIWCRWGPLVGARQLRNIDAFADAYRAYDSPNVLGMITTNWVPGRYIQNAIWPDFAYAAVAMAEGSDVARASAFARVVEEHFGAAWDAQWADAFRTLHDVAPHRPVCSHSWMTPRWHLPWASDADVRQVLQQRTPECLPYPRVYEQLTHGAQQVKQHGEDLQALLLTVEYLGHLEWRERKLHEAWKGEREPRASILQEIAKRDAALAERLLTDWQAGRAGIPWEWLREIYADEPADRLHEVFLTAAAYSTQLAAEPEQLIALMADEREMVAHDDVNAR